MESLTESDEILSLTQLVPPKYQTNVANRVEATNFKYVKKNKAHDETFGNRQAKKKNKTKE